MADGRPAKFNSPEEMQAAIDVYFAECDPHPIKVQFERTNPKTKLVEVKTETRLSHPIPYTMTGLARALGFESRSSFRDYKRRGKFSLTVKQAKMKIEEQLEVRMLTSNGVVAGIIFNAKNRLFAVESVGGVAGGSAFGGRGVPMMGVLTPPDRKTSTWMTLLLRTASAVLI